LIGSFGDGGYGGIAVRLISVPIDGFGEPGATSVFSEANSDRPVTGRMEAPLKWGDLGEDITDFGVKGLNVAGLNGVAFFGVLSKFDEPN
jgi:hypothetical protein